MLRLSLGRYIEQIMFQSLCTSRFTFPISCQKNSCWAGILSYVTFYMTIGGHYRSFFQCVFSFMLCEKFATTSLFHFSFLIDGVKPTCLNLVNSKICSCILSWLSLWKILFYELDMLDIFHISRSYLYKISGFIWLTSTILIFAHVYVCYNENVWMFISSLETLI